MIGHTLAVCACVGEGPLPQTWSSVGGTQGTALVSGASTADILTVSDGRAACGRERERERVVSVCRSGWNYTMLLLCVCVGTL